MLMVDQGRQPLADERPSPTPAQDCCAPQSKRSSNAKSTSDFVDRLRRSDASDRRRQIPQDDKTQSRSARVKTNTAKTVEGFLKSAPATRKRDFVHGGDRPARARRIPFTNRPSSICEMFRPASGAKEVFGPVVCIRRIRRRRGHDPAR